MKIKLIVLAVLVTFSSGCAHRPIMEGCKKLPMQDRDWSECEKQVA